ncbi:capsular polysaccharide export protein [Corticibacter populi]|nr:capsular polysaccharide export protein [Corticibacter populi]
MPLTTHRQDGWSPVDASTETVPHVETEAQAAPDKPPSAPPEQPDSMHSMPVPLPLRRLMRHKRVLLLQGPMGPFFSKLAQFLKRQDVEVGKVNFNGGDALFYRDLDAVAYTGRHEDLHDWLHEHIRQRGYEAIVLFGQCRPVHKVARGVAQELGLAAHIFEEGYIRPDYITLEESGVNAWSPLPRDAAFYRSQAVPEEASHRPKPQPTAQRFRKTASLATLYAIGMAIGRIKYRHHVYHRPLNPLVQGWQWGVIGGLRKLRGYVLDRPILKQLTGPECSGRYFVLPLQVHNDSQMVDNSPFGSNEDLIEHVLRSFAAHAKAEDLLVIKHHPMDRAYRNYSHFIHQQACRLGIGKRIIVAQDLHLPTLLDHAKGLVTVNSTTGLQALLHNTPVAVLGACAYDIEGLVFGQGRHLDQFWAAPGKVDLDLFWRYRNYLIEHTQLNASFYARAPVLD